MKRIIKFWFVSFVSLLIVAQIVDSVNFTNNYLTIAQAAVFLTLFEYFLKPVVKLLLLPINLITLGTVRWLVNVISLYLATILIVGFSIAPYYFAGINNSGFVIPSIQLSLFWTYVLVSFLLNIVTSLINWTI